MSNTKNSIKELWSKYLNFIGEEEKNTNLKYESWYFGNTEELAKELVDLVLKGEKRATTSLYCLYGIENEALPKVGELSVVTDFNGIAKCIIRTNSVKIIPFSEVDDNFAYTEGEGDKSLAYWRKVHADIFNVYLKELNMKFSEDMLVVCEEFEVVFQ